ncbi:hypothetical protein NC653_020360 [Populus alba x Populus x berolinensis]|uniref:Factor of DNA methylation 1-5/IDN2 domain-containing protein n=1 Tax=Populus alba x Populus x berolinensis TaxID=444605 RepID=A0AAD6QCD3_9ROSI|nr:hypothetical protein NC653_020360 [Populus alba x Populus x berolinensis]
MGEAATEPFEDACLHSFSEDYEEKSTRICSLLQHDVTNPMWHPFKKEFVDGKFKLSVDAPKEVEDEDDRKLKEL